MTLTRCILAWLASAAAVTLVETWRALPDGSWSFSYLLLLLLVGAAVTAAWTLVLVPPSLGLAKVARGLYAREPAPLLWIGPAVAACQIAGRWLHRWEAKSVVRHDLAAGILPMLELVMYGAIVGGAIALHLATARWTRRIPRRAALGAAAALALIGVLAPLLRTKAILLHPLLPVALLLLFGLTVATAVQLLPERWLRWKPGRRAGAIALGVEVVLLLVAAYGGRIAPGTYPAALAAIRERQLVIPKVMSALTKLADRDGDDFSPLFGGADCDDGDPRINPFAEDKPGDGTDQDCFEGDLSPSAVEADVAALVASHDRPARMRTPNVVLVTIDAARADAFGFAGAAQPTPAVDALAARGTVFTRAYSQAPMTRESFPSMLAGRPPSRIHWLDQQNNYPYPVSHEDNRFLAEYLTDAGIATAFAVPFKYPVNAHFDQGFADKKVEPSSKFKNDTSAEKVVNDAIAQLDSLHASGRRFFLWVHFYEAHHPYVEHKGFERGKSEHKRYLSEIAWIDSQIGRLFAKMTELGLDGSTAVIFTGDHGEEFGEHGGTFHGDLHIEDLNVPLVVALPGASSGAMDVPVSLLDLAPTIAELLGIPIPNTFFGDSWLPWLEGSPPPEDRTVYAEVLPDRKQPRRLLTVIDARWQLIVDFQLGGRELYDLSRDPWGKRNLVADNPDTARTLELRLRRHMALRMNPVVVTKAKSDRSEVPLDDE